MEQSYLDSLFHELGVIDLDTLVNREVTRVMGERAEYGLPHVEPVNFLEYEKRRALNHQHFEGDGPVGAEVHGVIL